MFCDGRVLKTGDVTHITPTILSLTASDRSSLYDVKLSYVFENMSIVKERWSTKVFFASDGVKIGWSRNARISSELKSENLFHLFDTANIPGLKDDALSQNYSQNFIRTFAIGGSRSMFQLPRMFFRHDLWPFKLILFQWISTSSFK